MPTISLQNGTQFEARPGESILDAATRAQVVLAYSCRIGRCSTCKCKVVSGQSSALHEESGLPELDKASGWILGCVRTATTDLSLKVSELGVALPEIRTLPCRVKALSTPAPDVVVASLRMPANASFKPLPGQYVDVIGHGGVRRSYSLANCYDIDQEIELHVRAVPDGAMSKYWFEQAKTNDLLRLRGPLGTFFLRESTRKHLVFLATGTGIAPIKAILQKIREGSATSGPETITVYWGGRTQEDFYWDAIRELSGVRYVQVLSRAGEQWSGARGYVQNVFLADRPDLSETDVYACGSDAMIHSAQELLLTSGLPEDRFFSDAFVCSAAEFKT